MVGELHGMLTQLPGELQVKKDACTPVQQTLGQMRATALCDELVFPAGLLQHSGVELAGVKQHSLQRL